MKQHLLLEYAAIDSMGRNKGWHMHGAIETLDSLGEIVSKIKANHPGKSIKVKLYEYSTATGSKQILDNLY
jgi:hypothetical protein